MIWIYIAITVAIAFLVIIYFLPEKTPSTNQLKELAVETADALEKGMWVGESHAYYCGEGLEFFNGIFVYDSVQDGMISAPGTDLYESRLRREFNNREKFVSWLEEKLLTTPYDFQSRDITYQRLRKCVDCFNRFNAR